jgi:hypothetical protein
MDTHNHEEHCEEHCEEHKYMVGDRVDYKGEIGTVTRTTILGFRPCCAIQVSWDNEELAPKILQMHELCECVKH